MISNIKLDDVFSDVFGKAATEITTRLLKNQSEKLLTSRVSAQKE